MRLYSFVLMGATLLSSTFFSAEATHRDYMPYDEGHTESIRLTGKPSEDIAIMSVQFAAGPGEVEPALKKMFAKAQVGVSLREPLDDKEFEILGSVFSKMDGLESLMVTGPQENNSTLDGVKMSHLMKVLDPNRSLKTLVLRGHRLTADAVSSLIEAIGNNSSLEHFGLLDAIINYEDFEQLNIGLVEFSKSRPLAVQLMRPTFDPPTEFVSLNQLIPQILDFLVEKEKRMDADQNNEEGANITLDFDELKSVLALKKIDLLRMTALETETGLQPFFVIRPMAPSQTVAPDAKQENSLPE